MSIYGLNDAITTKIINKKSLFSCMIFTLFDYYYFSMLIQSLFRQTDLVRSYYCFNGDILLKQKFV
ncbi:MAG TPA: hypothetical protein VEV16_08560 [Daejeonella sp.]|nr:hypothetical protein [Daejeonella sp.]